MAGIPDYLEGEMSDAEWQDWLRQCARIGRGLLVTGLLLLSFLAAGVPLGRALAVACAALVLFLLNIGARWLERLGFAAFVLTAIAWLGLMPLQRWIASAIAAIDRGIGCGVG